MAQMRYSQGNGALDDDTNPYGGGVANDGGTPQSNPVFTDLSGSVGSAPGGDITNPSGNTDSPRGIFHPATPPTPGPSGDVQRRDGGPMTPQGGGNANHTDEAPSGGAASGAPPRPSTPSPVAAQPPAPFTPMEPLGGDPMSLVTPQSDYGSANVKQRAPFLSPSAMYDSAQVPGGLLGKAGGLLGGGLGLPGATGGGFQNDPSNILDSLIRMLKTNG